MLLIKIHAEDLGKMAFRRLFKFSKSATVYVSCDAQAGCGKHKHVKPE